VRNSPHSGNPSLWQHQPLQLILADLPRSLFTRLALNPCYRHLVHCSPEEDGGVSSVLAYSFTTPLGVGSGCGVGLPLTKFKRRMNVVCLSAACLASSCAAAPQLCSLPEGVCLLISSSQHTDPRLAGFGSM